MIYKQDYFGFVYLWFDRRHRRYYLGSHMGDVNDKYVCSCNSMREAHRRHPGDFRRRIIWYCPVDDLTELRREEQRLLQTLRDDEVSKKGYKGKYYNKTRSTWVSGSRDFLSEQSKLYHNNPEKKTEHKKAVSKSWTPERKAAHAAKLQARWESGSYSKRDNTPTAEGRERQRQATIRRNPKTWEIKLPDGRTFVVTDLQGWCKQNGHLYSRVYHNRMGYESRKL
jgi:hypothetical protein